MLEKNKLKGAIVTRFGSQAAAAPRLGISERRLSRVINGHERLRPDEARALEAKLGCPLWTAGGAQK